VLRKKLAVLVGGALMALLLLAFAGIASAAPPGPVDLTDTIRGVCEFPVSAEVSGKTKSIEKRGGRSIVTSPRLRVTLTNVDEPTNQVSYVITGAVHRKPLPSGDLLFVYTGRNLLFDPTDPTLGMVLTIGRFTSVLDQQTGTFTFPTGNGRIIDVCARLA
jgi:hypothetical protein